MLLALCLPPLAPWWLVVSGVAFAILLAKHLFGGLGANPFNPAMVGYAVLLVSFPARLLQWLPPNVAGLEPASLSLVDTLTTILTGMPPARFTWDAITSPTPLTDDRNETFSVAERALAATGRRAPVVGRMFNRVLARKNVRRRR